MLRVRAITAAAVLLAAGGSTRSQDAQPGDLWLTNAAVFPTNRAGGLPAPKERFASLHAGVADGRLKMFWTNSLKGSNEFPVIIASEDRPGRWAARDWRSYPMTRTATNWETTVPMDDPEIPVIYFLNVVAAGATNHSPMRIFWPLQAEMLDPSRPFSPFLEGFEDGRESWELAGNTNSGEGLRMSREAHSGYRALAVSLPEGRASVTVATTRVRGWRMVQTEATGLRLWLRAKNPGARVHFTLFANAFSPNQAVSESIIRPALTNDWNRISLPFASFPDLPISGVDWFAIELIGPGPNEFFLDDLEYLGPWKQIKE